MARRRSGGRRQRGSLASAVLVLLSSPLSSPSFGIIAAAAKKTPVPVPDARCQCFVANGTTQGAYYSAHQFYDFRQLSQYAVSTTPSLLQSINETMAAPLTSSYFNDSAWTSFWQIQNWATNSTLLRVNSLNNVYIERNTDADAASATWLTLRTARESTFQSAAEMVSVPSDLQFLSMRMLARTTGAPGGCMAMFTYRESDNTTSRSGGGGSSEAVQEVDLEVLTKYPKTHVQCTNQPSLDDDGQLIAAATVNATLPNGRGWDEWAVYRLDWTPGYSTWYVDGTLLANISFQTPRDASRIHINAWSDGSSWTGSMARDTEAHLQIQWWELLYNTTTTTAAATAAAASGSGGTNVCRNVCSIDVGNATDGQAVLVASTGALRFAPRAGLLGWVPSAVTLLLLAASLSL